MPENGVAVVINQWAKQPKSRSRSIVCPTRMKPNTASTERQSVRCTHDRALLPIILLCRSKGYVQQVKTHRNLWVGSHSTASRDFPSKCREARSYRRRILERKRKSFPPGTKPEGRRKKQRYGSHTPTLTVKRTTSLVAADSP